MTQSSPPHYPPFGSSLPNRTWSDANRGYRFGFNNQEKEEELGEFCSFEFRIANSRLGRFLSVDPLFYKYPFNSSYAFCENRVIDGIELEGLEVSLTNVSREEKIWSFWNPISAYLISENVKVAFSHADATSFKNKTDGQQDAFRHAFWNALNEIDVGVEDAVEFATLHEKSNQAKDPVACQMDLYNNEIGRNIADKYIESVGGKGSLPSNWEDVVDDLVEKAVTDGKLKIIKMDSGGHYLDKDGYRIDQSKDGWEKKKYMVNSNEAIPDASKTKLRPSELGDSPDNSKMPEIKYDYEGDDD